MQHNMDPNCTTLETQSISEQRYGPIFCSMGSGYTIAIQACGMGGIPRLNTPSLWHIAAEPRFALLWLCLIANPLGGIDVDTLGGGIFEGEIC